MTRDAAAHLRVVSHRRAADLLRGARQRRPRAGDRSRRSRRVVDPSRRTTAASSISPPARAAWRVDLDTFEEEQLADFGAVEMRENGMVGAAMGTTAAVGERPLVGGAGQGRPGVALRPDRHRERRSSTRDSRARHDRPSAVLPGRRRPDSLCRAAHRPRLDHRSRAAPATGGSTQREHRDAVGDARELARRAGAPRLRRLAERHARDRRRQRRRCAGSRAFPAWHAHPGRHRTLDRLRHQFPDLGLHVYPVLDAKAAAGRASVASEASVGGTHWGGPFPYNDGPSDVYAPQHTHPHPRFVAGRHARPLHLRRHRVRPALRSPAGWETR